MSKSLDEAKRLMRMGLIRKEAYEIIENKYNEIVKKASDVAPQLEKTAAGIKWQHLALAPVLGAAALGGAHAIGAGIEALVDKHRMNKSKEEMFVVKPELKEVPKEQLDRAFQFLAHFAPSMASNPVAAANMVWTFVNMPAMGDAQTVKTLVDVQKSLSEDRVGTKLREAIVQEGVRGVSRGINMGYLQGIADAGVGIKETIGLNDISG